MPEVNSPSDYSTSSPAFVFQDSASELSSEYQAGSEASSSVHRILTHCTASTPAITRSNKSVPIPSGATPGASTSATPSQIYTTNNPYRPQQPHNHSNSLAQQHRSAPLSPRSSGDVSSITSYSMTSAYTSSDGESSIASPSNTSCMKKSSSKSRLTKKARPRDNLSDLEASSLSITSSESQSSSPGFLGRLSLLKATNISSSSTTGRPLHQYADQSEEDMDNHPTTCSWALSPSSISSIPEEKNETSNNRPPRPNKKSFKEVIACNVASLPSPPSRTSLRDNSMDNSSIAMESAASGLTGAHSEATQQIRNTSGMPLPPNQRDTERGPIPIHQLPKPPMCMIPSGRTLDVEEGGLPQKDDKSNKKSVCRGTQGWIIGLLVALFVFGVITVVVSFVLSKKNSSNVAVDPITAITEDDMILYDSSPIDDDDTLFVANNDSTDDDFNRTFVPSSVPTTTPFLDEADAEFADAVEQLLNGNSPTPPPSLLSSSPPSTERPSTNAPTLGIPTESPSATPTQNPTTLMPTTAPTTASPTQPAPLLAVDTTLTQEAQVWGDSSGDAAGSSTALSGNGKILLMGSPNANSAAGVERAGKVHVYERIISNPNGQADWILRATLLGGEEMNQLGFSLATNHDGSIVAVSEPTAISRRGRVTIYEWLPDQAFYEAQQVLRGTATADHFGISISLSDDGRRLAVGSPYHSTEAKQGQTASNLRGEVQIFEYAVEQEVWETMRTEGPDTLLGAASLDWFGWSVSLSRDGKVLAVGAPRNTEFGGYVQCFRHDGRRWKVMGPPMLNLVPPVKLDDRFGHSVSVTTMGTRPDSSERVTRVAVGSPWKDVGNTLNSGMVAIYEWSDLTSSWSMDATGALGSVLSENEPGFYHQLGYSMEMEGDVIAVGVPGWDNRRGLVNVFWLPHAFGGEPNDASADNTYNELINPLTGETSGDDFGFSASLILQRAEDEEPSSVMVASGAIMVSTADADATGYSKVYQTGQVL